MPANTIKDTIHIQEMYQDYFLEYASYVITDRAVPYLNDGLKPVQRRILHSLHELDDGRFHKAANVIGNTMKYHPHGDAAIRDAMVNIAQKGLMIETQGNWGDHVTGDAAAAPRYVECKLSKFALEVGFNKRTTKWQSSYDGRNQEPTALPIKFPLLLAQGAEGIAVGLATKILPHNFLELLDCCIKILKKEDFILYPDFPTGGFVDVSNYNDGQSGGKIKIRAKIETTKTKSLIIREIPYGTTTVGLMESIVTANEKGKIKIRRIEDNTAKDVEIIIYLSPGAEPEKVIDALYAFTDCEVSISPNCCVIKDKHPAFIGVSEMLRQNVKDTVALLKAELLIRQHDLEEKWHFRSLEQIFIEERIYRKIETCKTWDAIIKVIRQGLEPFKKKFIREVTDDDITKLTEIRIKRISRFDAMKAEEEMISLEKGIAEVKKYLRNLTKFAISWYENIIQKYGKGKERKAKIQQFEEISRADVILSNLKVFYDKKTGFIGTSVRADNSVSDCSKLDDIIVFTEEGFMVVTKVAAKTYVGKNIIYAAKFDKTNSHIIYNMVYRDGRIGPSYVKRFSVGGVTRDKQYALTKGKDNSRVFYFSLSPRQTSEKVLVKLVPKPRIKKEFTVKLSDYEVKGRGSGGNIITKYSVKSVRLIKGTASEIPAEPEQQKPGSQKPSDSTTNTQEATPPSTTHKKGSSKTVYWDTKNKQIGFKVKGEEVCKLEKDDHILLLYDDGSYITYKGQDCLEVGDGILFMDKWDSKQVFTVVYIDGGSYALYGKKFQITSITEEKYYYYISDYEDSKLKFLTAHENPIVDVELKIIKGGKNKPMTVFLDDENYPTRKASHMGTRITTREVKNVKPSKKNQLSFL
ncbi:MAG: DNA gyrase/topoisomerase IV subunit A [Fibrobacteria bacterium]|nr:DNA gyrase/topoisomerase IV subunit A [Fibrobacteria bacterium]